MSRRFPKRIITYHIDDLARFHLDAYVGGAAGLEPTIRRVGDGVDELADRGQVEHTLPPRHLLKRAVVPQVRVVVRLCHTKTRHRVNGWLRMTWPQNTERTQRTCVADVVKRIGHHVRNPLVTQASDERLGQRLRPVAAARALGVGGGRAGVLQRPRGVPTRKKCPIRHTDGIKRDGSRLSILASPRAEVKTPSTHEATI